MARPNVKKQLELPATGAPLTDVTCRLRLIASTTDLDGFGYAGTANADVGGIRIATPSSTGLVTFSAVRPNSGADGITAPADTVYELLTDFGRGRLITEHITVPDTAGDLWVQDLLTVAPGTLVPPAAASAADLTAETAARIAAITAEATARASADTAETAARIAADSAEATARAAADTAEATARAAADTAEATARAAADTAFYKTLAADPEPIIAGTLTRDANEAVTSAPVVWPDGSTGTFTATTVSTAFPGAVDAWTVTYGSPVTRTYTQSLVTRDAAGAVTIRPAITVS